MENQKASSRHKTLSLVDMSSAFVVLGLGISLSILVFLIELIYKRINDHYFTVVDRIRPVMIRRMRRQKMIESIFRKNYSFFCLLHFAANLCMILF